MLLEAYARLGPAWNEIANLIPGRKDDQCSKRHRDILAPLAKNRLFDWTPEEDQILRDGVRDLGHRWTSVAARLPGRPPLTCRNRWRNLCRHEAAQASGQQGAGAGAETEGTQLTRESSAVSRETSQPISPDDGTALETQLNFQDFIPGESTAGPSPVTYPEVPDTSYAPSPLKQTYHAGLPAGNEFLDPAGHLDDGLQAMDLTDPSYWQLDTPVQPSGPSPPEGGPFDAGLGPAAAALQPETEAGQADSGPAPGGLDYRALELASEMSARADQPGPGITDAGDSGSSVQSSTQSSQQGQLQITHRHLHYHHYHHHHHHYHHHHYHHHYH